MKNEYRRCFANGFWIHEAHMETMSIIVGVAVLIAVVVWFVYQRWIAIILDSH